MAKQKGFLIYASLYFLILITTTNGAKIIYSKVECANEDPDYFTTVNCNMTAADIPRFNFNFRTRLDINDAMFDLSLTTVFFKTSISPNELLNVTRSFCKLLSQSKSIIWETLVKEAFRSDISNIPRKCPLKKDTLYSVNNHVTTASMIPQWAPDTAFVVRIRLHKKERRGALLILKGHYFNS